MRTSIAAVLVLTATPAFAQSQDAPPAETAPRSDQVPAPPAATTTSSEPATTEPSPPAVPEHAPGTPEGKPAAPVITVGGYFEEYYQLSFQNPSNRITNLRGFDNRSRTFTLSNVAIDVKGVAGPLTTHIILQVGHTPSTYYLGEPLSVGTPSVDTSDGALWKYIQNATLTATAPGDFVIDAGIFPSPIGPEVLAIKDNWNWSRSNLFFGLPFYHTGVTVSHLLRGGWTGKLFLINGWNSVVDNNGVPSVAASIGYTNDKVNAQFLYFGGIERPSDSPEGQPWRNLVDALFSAALNDQVSVGAEGDAGFERGDLGTSWWAAVAGYVKFTLGPELYAAVRGDFFYEGVPDNGVAMASPIFWPVPWVAEGTATIAYQPIDHASVRLEYRHDQGDGDAYFGGSVTFDPLTMAAVPNRNMQDTVTLGVTAWF